MILSVRPFESDDCIRIFEANPFPSSVVELGDRDMTIKGLSGGKAYTAIGDGEIIGSSGIMPLFPRVGEGWLLATPLIHRCPIFVLKTVRRLFIDLASTMNLRRIQTVVKLGSDRDCIWVEKLGFKFEGILRAYSEAGDFIRYARIFGG